MSTDDDVTWARATLGPANPVPTARAAASDAPPAALAPAGRRRRAPRALIVGALASAAALVAAVVATTALGGGTAGSGHAPGGSHAVFAAAAATEAAGTADISVSVTTGAGSLSGQGTADLTSGNADFTVDLPASLGQVEVRSVGGTIYVQVPSALTALTGGKAWASVSGPQVSSALPASFDATWLLDWLRAVAGPVTTVSTSETVHGDATTHYRATIDPSKLGAASGQLQPLDGQTIPVDLWVDNAGRARRLTASFDASATQAASLGSVQLTVELWGFGTPVDVTAPPADQVANATGLLPAAQRLLPGLAGQ